MRIYLKIIIFLLVLSASSCNKDFNIDSWEPKMLMPLAKGKARIQDVTDLRNKKWVQQIPAFDIGYTEFVAVNVPPLNIPFVGPYPYEISEYINYVFVDSLDFSIELKNYFPIAIQAGTRIVFRSTADTTSSDNIILQYELPYDVAPNQEFTVNSIVTNKFVNNNIYLYLEDFKSPGGNNVIFSGQPSEIRYELRFLSVVKVGIKTNKEVSVVDSTEISAISESDDYNDSTATGKLSLFVTNTVPTNFDFQMYFYDESRTVFLDSIIYGSSLIPSGTTDTEGLPTSKQEKKFEIPLTADRIARLKQARFCVYRLKGDTYGKPGTNVTAGSQCSLEIQITGDLSIRVAQLFNLNL